MLCKEKCHVIKSTAINIIGCAPNQIVQITIPKTDLCNLERYCLVLTQCLPCGSSTLPTQILNGTQIIPLLCKCGNIVRSDQLHSRRAYPVLFGNYNPHFIMLNYIPVSGYKVCEVCHG